MLWVVNYLHIASVEDDWHRYFRLNLFLALMIRDVHYYES